MAAGRGDIFSERTIDRSTCFQHRPEKSSYPWSALRTLLGRCTTVDACRAVVAAGRLPYMEMIDHIDHVAPSMLGTTGIAELRTRQRAPIWPAYWTVAQADLPLYRT